MRKITRDAITALLHRRSFSRSNTRVAHDPRSGDTTLYLFGHPIIIVLRHGTTVITTAKHPTNTTKERLNGLPGIRVYHRNHQLYLNDHPWNGCYRIVGFQQDGGDFWPNLYPTTIEAQQLSHLTTQYQSALPL